MVSMICKLEPLHVDVIKWLLTNGLTGVEVSHNPPGLTFSDIRSASLAAAAVGWDYQVNAVLMALTAGRIGRRKYEKLIEESNNLILMIEEFVRKNK